MPARAPRALGGLLLVPALALSLARPAAGREPAGVHLVEPGQTAWSIAHAYGVKVEDLLAANEVEDPAELRAGALLDLPEGAREAAPARAEPRVRLGWPLEGRVTSAYGRRRRSLHAGIDIAAATGTIIVAAAEGTVARAGDRWGRYGKVVLIEHERGATTLYAHTARTFVKPGERVRRGQAIAAVGRTGNATGPHLHFELWLARGTVDPLLFLEAGETDAVEIARR